MNPKELLLQKIEAISNERMIWIIVDFINSLVKDK